MAHKIIKYSSFIIFAVILILSGLLFWNFQSTKADAMGNYELTGWIWSHYYSWISLNSGNLCAGSSCVPYSITMSSTTQEIYGWGWSSYLGWVCFGSTCIADQSHICNGRPNSGANPCNPGGFGTSVPQGGWKISVANGVISGWAKILSLGDNGWISFKGNTTVTPSNYLPACYNCSPSCLSWKPSTTPPLCLERSTSTFDSCKMCFSTDKLSNQPRPPGTPSWLAIAGGSGKLSLDCTGVGGCRTIESSGARRIICDTCSSAVSFGTGINSDNGSLVGWGWNGNASDSAWIHFNPDFGGANILFPWLETSYGSIYGNKSVRQKGSIGKNNATYCIFAKDITGMKSGNCDALGIVNINFPTSSSTNVYRNALGKIDVKGLEQEVTNKGGKWYNKYGNELATATDSLFVTQISLDNKVYKSTGNLTIGSGLKFDNGASYGNGTIIVNGNLIINNDFSYVSASGVTDLRKLASVAWIVKGDVIINGNVGNTVGAFIALGRDNITPQYESGSTNDYPKYISNGYGVVFSSVSENPLTVYGVMVAKAFDFRRTYANPSQGAERIIYDGRIIANPPPGFKGFVEGLPIMKDF